MDLVGFSTQPGEFRLFFPMLCTEEEQTSYKNFGDAIDKLSKAFTALGGEDIDEMDTEQMIYVVGRPHWGAKYRGTERKLQVKYRKGITAIGGCPYAIEYYKKKKYGNSNIEKMKAKLLEKLKKFCGDQQTPEEVKLARQAFDQERLIALNKKRKAYYHNDLSIEYAYLTIDEAESTFRDGLQTESGPFRDSPARRSPQSAVAYRPRDDFEKQLGAIYTLYDPAKLPVVSEIASAFVGREALLLSELHMKYDMEGRHSELFEGHTEGGHLECILSQEAMTLAGIEHAAVPAPLPLGGTKQASANTEGKSAGVVEWLSICLEGDEGQIRNFVQSSDFALLASALEEGIKVGAPVMVGGYPTFVSLVGNGLAVGDECDNEAYEIYLRSFLSPTQAIVHFAQQGKAGARTFFK